VEEEGKEDNQDDFLEVGEEVEEFDGEGKIKVIFRES
jgi:hypothetical protein